MDTALSIAPVEPAGAADDFVLDVKIVEPGPGRLVLLSDTDDGCDTEKPGDC
jgi:FxLD family lantipeptide